MSKKSEPKDWHGLGKDPSESDQILTFDAIHIRDVIEENRKFLGLPGCLTAIACGIVEKMQDEMVESRDVDELAVMTTGIIDDALNGDVDFLLTVEIMQTELKSEMRKAGL